MSLRSNGGVLGPRKAPAFLASSGVWSLRAQQRAKGAGLWPATLAEYTSLLLLGETEADSSPNNLTVTKVGNAAISTTKYKYGSSSWYLDGSGDRLTFSTNTPFLFGSGDFTVEGWINPQSPSAYDVICGVWTGTASTSSWLVAVRASSTQIGFLYSTGSTMPEIAAAAGTLANNTWSHFAVVRNGSSITIYVNGAAVASGTYAGSFASPSTGFVIGSVSNGTSDFPMYLDEFRILKGVALYTSDFTPPGTFA